MLNYIRAELYRNFNRAYLWLYTGIISALAVTLLSMLKNTGAPNMGLSDMVKLCTYALSFPVFLVAAMLDMVTAEEQKNQTLRNVVTFGVSRSKIILSKIIVSIILAVVCAVIISLLFFGTDALLLGLGKNFPGEIKQDTLRILAAVPLWCGAIAVGTFIFISISNIYAASFVYAGLFSATSKILQVLAYLVSDKFNYIRHILITTQLENLGAPQLTSQGMLKAVFVGISYTVVFTVLSMIYFKKKEIK